jgi:hypothetical protein
MIPFQTRVSVQIPNNGNTAEVKVATVPNNRRLVIEYVSCDITLPTGQQPFVFIATNVVGSGALIHRLFAEFQATFDPGDFFVVSQLTRLYAAFALRFFSSRSERRLPAGSFPCRGTIYRAPSSPFWSAAS